MICVCRVWFSSNYGRILTLNNLHVYLRYTQKRVKVCVHFFDQIEYFQLFVVPALNSVQR